MDAMKSSHDEIALQGIEFWSNVCDEEYELQLLQQEVKKNKLSNFLKLNILYLGTRTKSSTRTNKSLLCSWCITIFSTCITSTINYARRKR
jgi:hypothetical protein